MVLNMRRSLVAVLVGILFVASCSSQNQFSFGRPYPLARARTGREFAGATSNFLNGAANQVQQVYNQGAAAVASALDAPAQQLAAAIPSYTPRYPLTAPVIKYRIGAISDLDGDSLEKSADGKESSKKSWVAYLREADLNLQQNLDDPGNPNITIEWKEDRVHTVRSGLSYSDRGVELSTLNVFNGRLYSCDDKTGVVYELPITDSLDIVPIPWAILADGNYTGPNGFKCEWATVKDNKLWIGGHGQNSVDRKTGEVLSMNYKFIKVISPDGGVQHLDWRKNFDKMAEALDIHFPGYVQHEACNWSDILQKWLFMPRYISKDKQVDADQADKGSNTLIFTDENFDNIQVGHAGDLKNPSHGFSSFKFVPGTQDQVVLAIKSVEIGDMTESYIMAFNVNGKVLLPESKFADQKFEGVEFI